MTHLFGYSTLPPSGVMESSLSGELAPGDWVVADDDCVISARVGAVPYFVTCVDGSLVHGPDLFAVAARSGTWRWNTNALRDMVWQGHASGVHTLCAGIFRMPSDSLVRVVDGQLSFESRGSWLRQPPASSVTDAIDALTSAIAECDGYPLVSLSAGFDSRLLLAAIVAAGRTPRVAVMGPPDAADRVAAEHLARRLELELEVVELTAADYLAVGPDVARLTGGAKLASNWHTYHYARALSHRNGPHFVGANGEFARTFYLKGKRAARAAGALPGAGAVGLYFAARAALRGRRAPSLVKPSPRSVTAYSLEQGRNARGAAGGALDAFDYYYATQRVRQLIGDGMALYRDAGAPVSPFLDFRWIDAVRGLDRRMKLGEAFHREAISRLAPSLASVPFGSGGAPYSPWQAAVTDTEAVEEMVECSALEELWTRDQRAAAASSATALDLMQTVSAAIAVRGQRWPEGSAL